MRVAYVSVDPGIPVHGTKGASVHVQEIVREFRARGDEVVIFATRIGDDVPDDLADVEVVHVPVDPAREADGTRTKDPAARERAQQAASDEIARRVRAWGPDLVYERYSLFSTVIAELAPINSVLEVNAPLVDEQATHRVLVHRGEAEAALRRQVGAASVTTCVSDLVRDWVLDRTRPAAGARGTGPGHVVTVPNGVSTTRIRPVGEPAAPVVTFVGTLKPWHGTRTLLEAQRLARTPWQVRIIGDGPEREALEAFAREHDLDVDFRGAVAPSAIPSELAGSAAGAAPYPRTDRPGDQYFSPLKVYEYLAAGMPVVASAVGQVPAIIDHGRTGLLVEPSDPQALADAIDELFADPRRRSAMAAAARAEAEEHHNWASILGRVLQEVA